MGGIITQTQRVMQETVGAWSCVELLTTQSKLSRGRGNSPIMGLEGDLTVTTSIFFVSCFETAVRELSTNSAIAHTAR